MHSNDPLALYHSTQLRRIEAAAQQQPLMLAAGSAAAELANRLCTKNRQSARKTAHGKILVLAGPGNNGGDALVAAHQLHRLGHAIQLVFSGKAQRLPPTAADAYQALENAGIHPTPHIREDLHYSLIIDGLFGIGLNKAPTGIYAQLIKTANALAARDHCPLLALDCPSGLSSDTGVASPSIATDSAYAATIRASHTLSFIAHKPGLFTGDGPDYCGQIYRAELGIKAAEYLPPGEAPCAQRVDTALFTQQLQSKAQRPKNSHKGSYGKVGIIGGARGMLGAALLAGRAALKLGSGCVYLGLLDANAPSVDLLQPELMLRTAEALCGQTDAAASDSAKPETQQPLAAEDSMSVLACGPGMGQSTRARSVLLAACRSSARLVLDADALNLLAADAQIKAALVQRQRGEHTQEPCFLTPHPAEAARLLACSKAAVQADRLAAALALAKRYRAFVVLKGCGSVIATPTGECFINTTGNPALATAGSGDVLTGILSALLAQGWPSQAALLAAVHLHGLAADRWRVQA
ncbi:MAG: NAD(P)H-hydrate dehydratase, partial [Pseudomonadota bacterium]